MSEDNEDYADRPKPKMRDVAMPQIPVFDPGPSAEVVYSACGELGTDVLLIGRLAVWAWLNGHREPQFTRDMDVAVRRADAPQFAAWLADSGLKTRRLPIGGIQAKNDDETIKVDFIDRSDPEHGDLSTLIDDAFRVAKRNQDMARVGAQAFLLCPVLHLCVMKFVAGRDKDLGDLHRLLNVHKPDMQELRTLFRGHVPAMIVEHFERWLVRIGHAEARNYDDDEPET
jgi:hypothetical protein